MLHQSVIYIDYASIYCILFVPSAQTCLYDLINVLP